MLRTYVYERTYVLLKYDPRLKYPLCYDPQETKEESMVMDMKPLNTITRPWARNIKHAF